jgi:hypothetical protein
MTEALHDVTFVFCRCLRRDGMYVPLSMAP